MSSLFVSAYSIPNIFLLMCIWGGIILDKLGITARELLRKGESEYRDLGLADPALGESALIAAMTANPRLIERPIVLTGDRAAIGRPPESVLDIL